MSTRRKILIVVGGLLLLAAVVGLMWWLTQPKAAAPAPAPTPTPAVNLPPPAPVNPSAALPTPVAPPTPTATAEEVARRQITTTAMQFTERYGSYSNQGNYQNLRDLFPLMTSAMQRTAQATIDQGSAAAPTTDYVGVSTKAVSARITSFSLAGGAATAVVSAQRITTTGSAVPQTGYGSLTLELRLVSGVWKVDSATWATP